VNVTLVGNTVGPVYQWPGGADNTPGKNGGSPTSTIDFGTVGSASGQHTQLLQLLNITTDDDAANFSIKGAQSGNEFVSINFDANGVAAGYNAVLTLFTDEDVAFGASGNVYVYSLASLSIVTASMLLSIGIGGVLVVRKRHARSVLL